MSALKEHLPMIIWLAAMLAALVYFLPKNDFVGFMIVGFVLSLCAAFHAIKDLYK